MLLQQGDRRLIQQLFVRFGSVADFLDLRFMKIEHRSYATVDGQLDSQPPVLIVGALTKEFDVGTHRSYR